jgi:hypothetical protein
VKREFAARQSWIALALVFGIAVVIAWWWLVSAKRPASVEVRFLGYAFETPPFELGSFSYSGRSSSATRGTRVAQFLITNGCDYPVHCSLSVRYTNGFGSFSPRDISLEAHCATNVTGLASPPRGSALANPSVRRFAEWTNGWRLVIASRNALPIEGIDKMRYRTALWLLQRKLHRLGNFMNPVRIQATETDLIPPDLHVR